MYIKGLNGIRAIAAIVLLIGHSSQCTFVSWCNVEDNVDLYLRVRHWLPVCCAYVFFVISGFLSGVKSTQNRSLSKYYFNKSKRILPLYYFYIGCSIVVFVLLGRTDEIFNINLLYYIIPFPQLPFSGLGERLLPLVHLWFVGSLLIFYLIFPIVENLSGVKLLKVSLIIAICWFLLKCGLYVFPGKGSFLYKFVGVSALDCLFGGVALGVLVKENNSLVKKIIDSKIIAIFAWILFLISGIYGDYIPSPVRVEYIAILTGFLILSQLNSKPIIDLENKVCNWFGGISYEIYVMQIIVLILLSVIYTELELQLPLNVIYLIVIASVTLVAWCTNRLLTNMIRK